jgi:hypothetical protein
MKNEAVCFGSTAKVHSELMVHLRFQSDLSSAMMYAFHGKNFMDKNDLGNAIGCYDVVLQLLTEQSNSRKYDILAAGFPHSAAGPLAKLSPSIRSIKKLVEAQRLQAKRDNDFIYFQEVPSMNALPEIPAAIFVLKMTEFDPHTTAGREIHLFIHDAPKKGLFSSIISSMTRSPTNKEKEPEALPAAESAATAETRPRSDSEVARDFQRRINAGENL